MLDLIEWKNFKNGVVNAIPESEIDRDSMSTSENFYYRENRWRKMPGLNEINPTVISADPVTGISKYYNIIDKKKIVLAACGTDVYKFNEQNTTFESIRSSMQPNTQVEFLEYSPFIYFGSQYNKWQRYDGGNKSYPVGGNNGNASDAPPMFSQIIFSPFTGRFFGIGALDNPDILGWSEHIDNEGIEKWVDGNQQIVDSVRGDFPQRAVIFEGRITVFSQNSVSSGTVVGVPESWSFQNDRAQAGAIAGRTVQRFGNFFLMLTPDFEVYQWPNDKFITKGRVKFNINPYKAHLACAEIVDNRYYDIFFESGEAVSEYKYHMWRYDILGDRWYGPHLRRSVSSLYYDRDSNLLLCGGADEYQGFVMEQRGLNLKNSAMPCKLRTGYDFQGNNRNDKRYSMVRVKAKQEGSLAGGGGQLSVTAYFDQKKNAPYAQTITLEDPVNSNLANTGEVKDAIIKRGHIHEENARASSVQIELTHEVLNGNIEISEFEVEFRARTKKENRKV